MRNTIMLLAISLLVSNCKRQPKNTDEVVETFFNYAKNGDYEKAESLLWQKLRNDPEGEIYHLKRLHDLLVQYGIPEKKNWKITFDTTGEIVKMKIYTIELYKKFNQKKNRDEGDVIDFTFDYEQSHIGDSIMFFNLHPLWLENN